MSKKVAGKKKAEKKKPSPQGRSFSVVLEMETPPRIKKVEEWKKAHDKCPICKAFGKFDRLRCVLYPELSRWAVFDKIKALSERYGNMPYWAIVHDKDETRAHCHVAFTFPLKKTQQGALRSLVYILGMPDDRISVRMEKGDGLIYAIRYLMHLDGELQGNPDERYLYPSDEVHTNEPEMLKEAITLKVRAQGTTTRQLIDVVARCERLTDVIITIGIDAYRKYRPVIMDLWSEKRAYLDQRVNYIDRLKDSKA